MTRRCWVSPEAAALCAETGQPDPVAAISALAAALIDEAGFTEPPCPLPVLASFRNVREIRRVAMAAAGRLVPEYGALAIEVNRDHSPGKQNFSIGHEVSHTLIPTYRRQRIEDLEIGTFASTHEEELLCDIGAAALLLDPRWLRVLAGQAGPSIRTLFELATLFAASLYATARQLAQLDLWPCAFVFWEEGYRKGERPAACQLALGGFADLAEPRPKLRINAACAAASFGYFVPPNKSIDDASLVAACCERDPFTFGVADFDLGGRQPIRLYCENYYAPYWRGQVFCRRVISLLLDAKRQNEPASLPGTYQAEML